MAIGLMVAVWLGLGPSVALALGCQISQLRDYRALALAGDAAAQWRLGEALYWGLGVRPDRDQALDWYRRAAAQGSAPAKAALARIARGEDAPPATARLEPRITVCTLPGGACTKLTKRSLIALDGPPRTEHPPASRYVVMDRCR